MALPERDTDAFNAALVREGLDDEDFIDDEPTTIGRVTAPYGAHANDSFECDTAEHELPADHPAMRESSRLFRMDSLRPALNAPPAPSMRARRALELRRSSGAYGLHSRLAPRGGDADDGEPTFNQAPAHAMEAPRASGRAATLSDEMPTVQGTYVSEESPTPPFASAALTPASGSPAVVDAWQFEASPSPRRAGFFAQMRGEVSAALLTLGIPRTALVSAAAMTAVLAATGAWTLTSRPRATTAEDPAPRETTVTNAFAHAPEAALFAARPVTPDAAPRSAAGPVQHELAEASPMAAIAPDAIDGELNRKLLSFLRPRALRALRHGKHMRAAELGRRWVALEPTSAAAHQFMARVSLKQRRTTDAVRWAETAAHLRPKRGPVLETLGDAYLRAGRTAEAKDAYRRAARAGLRSAARKLRSLRRSAA